MSGRDCEAISNPPGGTHREAGAAGRFVRVRLDGMHNETPGGTHREAGEGGRVVRDTWKSLHPNAHARLAALAVRATRSCTQTHTHDSLRSLCVPPNAVN